MINGGGATMQSAKSSLSGSIGRMNSESAISSASLTNAKSVFSEPDRPADTECASLSAEAIRWSQQGLGHPPHQQRHHAENQTGQR